MEIDSFRYVPRVFRPRFAQPAPVPGEDEPVWAPFEPRLADATIALLSSAGLHVAGEQEPFDEAREWAEPMWGDPTFRTIPRATAQGGLGMMHLHVNNADPLADHEIVLPLRRLDELVEAGVVGASAETHVSVMGYQDGALDVWRTETAPAIVEVLRDQRVHGVVLAPV